MDLTDKEIDIITWALLTQIQPLNETANRVYSNDSRQALNDEIQTITEIINKINS